MTAGEYHDFESVEACDLCSGTGTRVVDAVANVVECRKCGHRYVTPRPTQAAIGAAYSTGAAYASWIAEAKGREALWDRRWRQVKSLVPAAAAAPGRLLDVGAGLGAFAAVAARDGWSVEATEVSSTAVAYARQHYSLDVRLGQLEEIELVPGYDVITLWHVIEHVPSPVATLRRCRELIADDGLLVLALPNDDRAAHALSAPGNLLRRLLRRPIPERYEILRPGGESHISHFTPVTIRKALAAAGFRVVSEGVDDAQPARSRRSRLLFSVRVLLTRLSPWNFGREMLLVAGPTPAATRDERTSAPISA